MIAMLTKRSGIWRLVLLICFCFGIFGFSTARFESYEIRFDSKKAQSTKVFEVIEEYIQSQGFMVQNKIEESYPEKKVITRLERAPVALTLVLTNSSSISLHGFQWRPGCTTIQEIAQLKELQAGLRQRVSERLGVEIEIYQTEPSKL
jgi:hypothetical protein